MWDMRPGTPISFWSPKFRNKPSVDPPVLLRLLSGLSIVSVVGVLVYAVALALEGVRSTTVEADEAVYVAVLHFGLPLCIAYTVSTNSWLSRPLIAVYSLVLCAATLMGKGYLGGLEFDPLSRGAAAILAFLLIMTWLFASPRMRIYYALLLDKPVPPELEARARELVQKGDVNPRVTGVIDWIADHLETVVLLGFIAAVLYAWVST